MGGKWAELAVVHQGRMLFARSLALGAGLAGDVKRSLSLFATGAAVPAPAALLLTGKLDVDLEQKLRDSAGVPVQRLDVLTKNEAVREAGRGAPAAAIGAAHLWARTESLPINFAAPKKPKAAVNVSRQFKIVAAAAAALLVVAAGVIGNRVLASQRAAIAELSKQKSDLETAFRKRAQERLDVEGLKEWEDTTIPWLDELYDLAARFPYQIGFRVKDLTVTPVKRTGKDPYVAQIIFKGIAKTNQDQLVSQLVDALNGDKHLRAMTLLRGGTGLNQEFQVKVDVAKQAANRYVTRLVVPPRPKAGMPDPAGAGESMPDTDPDAVDSEEGGAP